MLAPRPAHGGFARTSCRLRCLFRQPRKSLFATEEDDDTPRTIKQIGLGAQMLSKMGITQLELLTDSPATRYVGLDAFGLEITGTRPIMRG